MAADNWSGLTAAITEWNNKRLNAAKNKVTADAEALMEDIKKGVRGSTPETSAQKALTSKTLMGPEAKAAALAPSDNNKSQTSPNAGLDTYVNSIIIEDKSSATTTIKVVKIDDPSKKDETTGMSVVKIAKAIEFGTTKLAPQPAWRRSLKKLTDTGVYRKNLGT